MGVVGDYVAFPLTDRERDDVEAWPDFDDPGPEEQIVAVPTRGVFAEAKLASCNACEERDITRVFDFEESPCPGEAPPIAGVRPGTRVQPIDTELSELPGAVVNVQNAPSAPDPAGLASALKVLQASDLFRDMSQAARVASVLGALTETLGEVFEAPGSEEGGDDEGGTSAGTVETASGRIVEEIGALGRTLVNPRDVHDALTVIRRQLEELEEEHPTADPGKQAEREAVRRAIVDALGEAFLGTSLFPPDAEANDGD